VSYGGELIYTGGELFRAYALGLLVQLLPLFATVSYGVMVSTLTRSPAAAITATVGLWLLLDTVKYPLGVAPYLFTSYFETPWQPFVARVSNDLATAWFPDAGYCLGISAAYGLVFMATALIAFQRRNLHS
jgi:ABC-type transport system involved in multi-copper enzyme maturation permease subunit